MLKVRQEIFDALCLAGDQSCTLGGADNIQPVTKGVPVPGWRGAGDGISDLTQFQIVSVGPFTYPLEPVVEK